MTLSDSFRPTPSSTPRQVQVGDMSDLVPITVNTSTPKRASSRAPRGARLPCRCRDRLKTFDVVELGSPHVSGVPEGESAGLGPDQEPLGPPRSGIECSRAPGVATRGRREPGSPPRNSHGSRPSVHRGRRGLTDAENQECPRSYL